MLKFILPVLVSAGLCVSAADKNKKQDKKEKSEYKQMVIKNADFQHAEANGNPQRKTWWKSWHVHDKTKPNAMKLQREGYKYITQTIVKVNPDDEKDKNLCAKIVTPLSINELRDEKGEPMVSNGFAQTIAIKGGGDYILTFDVKGKLYKSPGFNQFVVVTDFLGGDKKPWKCKKLGPTKTEKVTLSDKWQNVTVRLKAPEGTDFMYLYLKIYGCGEAYYDNVKITKFGSNAK